MCSLLQGHHFSQDFLADRASKYGYFYQPTPTNTLYASVCISVKLNMSPYWSLRCYSSTPWITAPFPPALSVTSHSNGEKLGSHNQPSICLTFQLQISWLVASFSIPPWEPTSSTRIQRYVRFLLLLVSHSLPSFPMQLRWDPLPPTPSVRWFHTFAIQLDSFLTFSIPSQNPSTS